MSVDQDTPDHFVVELKVSSVSDRAMDDEDSLPVET
jgi:hypothetical protein